MTWFKVDDGLAFHAKVVQAGNAAMGLWVRAGSWCAQQLTDGFVPDHIVATLGTGAQAKRLVDARLWVVSDGGYAFHGWNEDGRQPTRAQVEQDRAEAKERMKKARDEKKNAKAEAGRPSGSSNRSDVENGSFSEEPQVSPVRSGEQVEMFGRSSGEVRSTRPDPSRPDLSSSQEEGGSHVSRAQHERPPYFDDRCARHITLAEPPPCGACADVRKARAAAPRLSLVTDRPDWCGACNEFTRLREYDDVSFRCPECHPLAEEAS